MPPFKTTDAEFNPTIHKKDATLFYKLVSLQNLAIYFNEAQSLLSDLNTKEEIIPRLLETIAVDDTFPNTFITVCFFSTLKSRTPPLPQFGKKTQKHETWKFGLEILKLKQNFEIFSPAVSIITTSAAVLTTKCAIYSFGLVKSWLGIWLERIEKQMTVVSDFIIYSSSPTLSKGKISAQSASGEAAQTIFYAENWSWTRPGGINTITSSAPISGYFIISRSARTFQPVWKIFEISSKRNSNLPWKL